VLSSLNKLKHIYFTKLTQQVVTHVDKSLSCTPMIAFVWYLWWRKRRTRKKPYLLTTLPCWVYMRNVFLNPYLFYNYFMQHIL